MTPAGIFGILRVKKVPHLSLAEEMEDVYMTFVFIVLAAAFVFAMGMLIGHTITGQVLQSRTQRQAATQRSLNSQRLELLDQWHELEAAWSAIPQQRTRESATRTLY